MLTYHSKHSKNRVTIVGEFCNEGLCMTAARQGDDDVFTKKQGREIAERRFKIKRHAIVVPVEGDRTPKKFIEIATDLAEKIHLDASFKKHSDVILSAPAIV